MTNIAKKALIYCRVSSKSQEDDGSGLESQETRCRQHAIAKGYDIVAVFPDTITGGGDFMQRPGMKSLLLFVDAQPSEEFVIIFDDLKRFARDTRFHLDLRDAFRRRGATIECLNFKFEDTPEGEFIETIMAAQGALERKQNGRQVAQKMKARMESGYWTHNPLIGYKFEAVKGRGKMLFPHEPLASIIREGFEGYASGRFSTQAEVTRFFDTFPDFPRNKAGLVLQEKTASILKQPLYAGYICSEVYGINWLKGQHEALISLETFEKVQERRQGATYAPKRQNIGDDFVLRGVVCCDDCEAPLRSSWSTSQTKKRYAYYLCQTKSCESYGKSMRRDKVERDVGDLLKALQPKPNLFVMAKAMFQLAWDQRAAQASEIIGAGQRDIDALDTQSEALLDRIMATDDMTMVAIYEKKIAGLTKKKALLVEKQTKQVEPTGTFEEKLEPALAFLSSPWKLWETGHIDLRRTILKYAFGRHIFYGRKQGARTPNYTLPFKVLDGFCSVDWISGAVRED